MRFFNTNLFFFVTKTQLLKNQIREPKKQRCMVPALIQCPQKLGSVVRVFEQAPKKPNSARRKVARVKIKHTGRLITCHLPGEGHNLSKHSTVLVRGGRCQDLIGVRYKPIRGKESFSALSDRVTRLSKYGVKKKPRFIEFRGVKEKSIESRLNRFIEKKKKLLKKFSLLLQPRYHKYSYVIAIKYSALVVSESS
jgi:small subunit ribosomal protein S12